MSGLAEEIPRDVKPAVEEVLRALDTTNEAVDAGRTEAGVDEDGTNKLASGLQEHQAAIDHVHHVLHGGLVVGVLAQVKKLAKLKMITELCVFHG